MEKKEEVVKNEAANAKANPAPIKGELTFADLKYVVGGVTYSPIYNGRTGGTFKSRFGGT
jgi:hypothetical protein